MYVQVYLCVCMYVCTGVLACMYVRMCTCVGPGGQVVQVFVLLMGHVFESHHSQTNIDHSSFSTSYQFIQL